MFANYSAELNAVGDQYEVVITGEVDLDAADTLVAQGRDGLDAPATRTLVLDLAAVTFIDSTGLGALVRLRKAAAERDKHIRLRRPSDRVSKMLELSALRSVFDVEE